MGQVKLGTASVLQPRSNALRTSGVTPARNVVAKDYRAEIQGYLQKEAAELAARGLVRRPENQPFTLFHQERPKRGLIILFHGFAAGTHQLKEIARDFHQRGFDVFVPALPGHGLLDQSGKEDLSLLPTGETYEQWDGFVDRMYQLGRKANRITPVGFSFGGMLALRMAEKHGSDLEKGYRVVRQVIALAPMLAFAGKTK